MERIEPAAAIPLGLFFFANAPKIIPSTPAISSIQPSIEMLVKIADLFSVSTDYLLCREKIRLETDGLTNIQISHIQDIINDIRK